MSHLQQALESIHRLILRAYPSEYLGMFGNEMHATFIEGCNVGFHGGRRDSPFWQLRSAEGLTGMVYPSPTEDALVVFVDKAGLYYIPPGSN